MDEKLSKNHQSISSDFSPETEENSSSFQKFQMMDNPYQKYIDGKAKTGQKGFAFIPPRKPAGEDLPESVSEKNGFWDEPDSNVSLPEKEQESPVLFQGESLPNPYGEAGWKNFGQDIQEFQIPVFQSAVSSSDAAETPYKNSEVPRKSGRNTGLIVFLAAAAVIFCGAAVWFTIMISGFGNLSYAPSQETEEESTEYIKYLRDDVAIELVPQKTDGEASAEKAYEKILPSTVLIISTSGDPDDSSAEVFQGTGVIIHSDGYIVTNSHVIENSRNTQTAVLDNGGNMTSAVVIGCDPETDIAVLKINRTGLVPAEFAETENLKVGQEIVALGNPEGAYFRNSLTKGIISAVNRSFGDGISYIQVDAAINPGNSGGPLCNMEGQIIGINTSKLAKENFEGIAFAIPSDTVRETANDIIKYGEVRKRLNLGIYGSRITAEDSQTENIPAGVLIAGIIEGGPAAESPLQPGDVLTGIDGETIDSVEDVRRILYEKESGNVIHVEYMRQISAGDGEEYSGWEENSCEIRLFYSESE